MLKNVIIAFIGFVVVGLVVLWIVNGGPRRVYDGVRNFSVLELSASGEAVLLPWQPPDIFSFINVEESFEGGVAPTSNAEEELSAMEQEYAQLSGGKSDVMTFGNPSPFFKTVEIMPAYSRPSETSASAEFITIGAPPMNTSPVSLAGWSLQSAVSGVRVYLPGAASPFYLGMLNTPYPVSLDPGSSATLVSGTSPVGTSFRENRCIGFLAQFQTFEPSLSSQCPSPYDELPVTAENLQRYGEACVDFVRSLPSCQFPQTVPAHVSQECRGFVQTTFSYNGCVNRHRAEASFSENSWRLYFGSNTELWKNLHDAIRLLDAQGQTVDVYVY